MWEICDECGEEVNRWYDMGTSYICDECLKNHRTEEGECDFCNDPEPYWLYHIDNIRICDQCIRFYERGMR